MPDAKLIVAAIFGAVAMFSFLLLVGSVEWETTHYVSIEPRDDDEKELTPR